MKDKIIIYHGSINVIEKPIYGVGKPYNDYGLGFYTTEDLELAKEWAVEETQSGFTNKYELDLSDLKILDLTNANALDWISILVENRYFDLKSDVAKAGKDFILKNNSLEYAKYDIIIGYRADDSYFMYASDFLNNSLSISSLEKALKLGNLGTQIVIKSEKAFSKLKFIGYEKADNNIYFPLRQKRNIEAKNKYLLERGKFNPNDIFLSDIIKGGLEKWYTHMMIIIFQKIKGS